MGLAFVEIVMQWEDALGVTLTEEDACRLLTPRLVIDLVSEKLDASADAGGACLTLRAFNRVRSAISSAAGISRSRVRCNSKLSELVPRHGRESVWEEVRERFQLQCLPPLRWGVSFCFLPSTVGGVARWVVAHDARSLKKPGERWTRSEIQAVIRSVVIDHTGVRDFSDDDSFVRDIGID